MDNEVREELNDEVRDELRSRFGGIVDGIGVRKALREDPFFLNTYEINLNFRNRFGVTDGTPVAGYKYIYKESLKIAMIEMIDTVETLLLRRNNIMAAKDDLPTLWDTGIKVILSHHLDDDVILMSPRTFAQIRSRMYR